MKKIVLVSLCLFLGNISFGQVSFTKDSRNNVIVEVSIDNLIKIMEMPSSEFKRIILSNGYNLSTVENDCTDFVKGSSADGTIHVISKCSLYLVTIGWFSLNEGNSNITQFMDEIEKYHAGYDQKMQLPVYQVKKNNSTYNFYIKRSAGTESVFCRK